MTDLSDYQPGDCGCSPEFRQPKPNGTCATCGGWLPGERPSFSLTGMWRGEIPPAPAIEGPVVQPRSKPRIVPGDEYR